ncbi:MAG: hypothetical protein A3D44_01645 [Candidatus Staskawiczbacteria bacterium RIFCSPHIGHO2_02_FULL_42_22]|uniref:Uncharacterized protein n=1 Tax=Candidatus Staskawiczbacteria bacterium RIFCSPHIGHO2_02_FULL_42_22 TaxID=1802207 RepID=A0A1G2I0M3_9BACT|nr:MAG: hypothetical protein A3D44_01645 [Candidatus Staskawiczbacteria bacterium RIFCSPHIGHO2_02_FULL_42_22]
MGYVMLLVIFFILSGIFVLLLVSIPLICILALLFGETEKQRGERVAREYIEWQRKRAVK